MDWSEFQTLYEGAFRRISKVEEAAWKDKVEASNPNDLRRAVDRITGDIAAGLRKKSPKLWELLAVLNRAQPQIPAESVPPASTCGLCEGSGILMIYGARTRAGERPAEWRLGSFQFDDTLHLNGKPYSAGVPCLCTRGRTHRDFRENAARDASEWRRDYLEALMGDVGARFEGELATRMVWAWGRGLDAHPR